MAAHPIPVVDRVPPALPGGAEVIGRHTGDGDRISTFVQAEKGRARPDVRAVMSYVDRADRP